MRINLAQLVVGGREFRIQLDDMLERLPCPQPIPFRSEELAKLKKWIGRLGFQLRRTFKGDDSFFLAALAAGQKAIVVFQ